jgi:hypothetical protein
MLRNEEPQRSQIAARTRGPLACKRLDGDRWLELNGTRLYLPQT